VGKFVEQGRVDGIRGTQRSIEQPAPRERQAFVFALRHGLVEID